MRPISLALTGLALGACLVTTYFLRTDTPRTVQAQSSSATPGTKSGPDSRTPKDASGGSEGVGCLGRLEPQDGVLQIKGGYIEGRPQRVRELKVKEGDQVHAGELLAVLDGKDQLETAVRLAAARVELARTRLAQVKAGAKASDIAAQKAQVNELKANLENARTEFQRYQRLHQKTDVSSAELDARGLAVESTEQKLQQAEERLKSISEVRATDVDVAQSELGVASAEEAHARAQLQTAMVYSPANGRVLRIYAYPGTEPGPDGLLDLGKTDVMYVVAEVYETDIARVRPGQHALIRSDSFRGNLSGVVETVGNTLSKNSVLPIDPVSYADARIFRVHIRLDKGNDVSGLINSKVNVVIQP